MIPQPMPVSRLTCFACGRSHDHRRLQTVCSACGMPLRVEVALPNAPPEAVIRPAVHSMWRYEAVLPVPADEAVTVSEGWTPLVPVDDGVWIKDESRNPTGSFKARGMSMAVSAAVRLGAERLVVPSAGNAAGALSAYGAAVGVPVTVAMPEDTPAAFVEECRHFGAQVHLVPGSIADAARFLAGRRSGAGFNLSTMREPYRVEGKKTIGYELFEQLGGVPDVVVCPTGGGTALVGIWKAFDEMEDMGWIGPARPRLVPVQTDGCAPVVRAFETGAEHAEPWDSPSAGPHGLRVPSPIGGFLCLRAIRSTKGTAVAVPESELRPAAGELAAATGIDACPEGGAAWAGYRRLRLSGWIGSGERVVVLNTGTGLKYRP